MSVLNENQLLGAPASTSQYQIQRSIRLSAPDSAYLSRTPASAGNRRTFTLSFWLKRGSSNLNGTERLGQAGTSSSNLFWFGFTANGVFQLQDYPGSSAANLLTNASFRDVSAWYHWAISVDTTQATAASRIRIYVNNTEQTFSTASYPAQNADLLWNAASQHDLGCRSFIDSNLFNGYLADIHFIDGQALTPSSFGQTDATTGEWIPKAYTGTYGTNGFKLDFADNSAATAAALGKDTSGNGNNFTPNNLSVTAGAGNDSLVDTPTSYGTDTGVGGEVRGNYCTLNPLSGKSGVTLTNGNLDRSGSTGNNRMGTFAMTSGKWYWEITVTDVTAAVFLGITEYDNEPDAYNLSYMYSSGGGKYVGATLSAYGASYGVNDVISLAYDADNGSLVCYKNSFTQGTLVSGLSGKRLFPLTRSDGQCGMSFNFGQRPFAYTAPSGFKALCDTNLAAPTIVKPSTVMDTVLYSGTGAVRSVSGLGFSPDLVWIKGRNSTPNHYWFDVLRGVGNRICSSAASAEAFEVNSLTSFDSSGFSYGNDSGSGGGNVSGVNYVAWCWDAGSSTVTNTAGTISSQVRANASAGFSVVTYTGTGAAATVGHGLGVAPQMMLFKSRSNTWNWVVYHVSIGNANVLALNTTAASAAYGAFNNTSPSSTVFTLGASNGVNVVGEAQVAYCFAPVAGYSAFGSYTGNGSTDGPFVYTGFRPRWVLIKQTSAGTENWILLDSARDTYNQLGEYLNPNTSAAAASTGLADFLSNGFKLRANTGAATNASAGTYIYAAFAEFPFQYARAR